MLKDALSRKDEDVETFLCAILIIQPDWIIEARDEWKNDEKVWTLIQRLQQDSSASSRVHLVFHISCLKKVIGDKIPFQTILPERDKEGKSLTQEFSS